jgi:hypothetical protein
LPSDGQKDVDGRDKPGHDDDARSGHRLSAVARGHSHSKNGVALLTFDPRIHLFREE